MKNKIKAIMLGIMFIEMFMWSLSALLLISLKLDEEVFWDSVRLAHLICFGMPIVSAIPIFGFFKIVELWKKNI